MTPSPLSADRIATASLYKFKSLPKTGKPSCNEWTVLSSILKYNSNTDVLEVVAIGTGTKCLGKDYIFSGSGEIINDSHAEVMSRRGFLRYILDSIRQRKHFTFDDANKKFRLDPTISFHFFTTHPPCGDASIFDIKDDDDEPKCKKPKRDENGDDNIGGRIPSTHATGGKLFETDVIDLMSQDIGEIRTKPGKGIRTLSVSCSDKLSRWNILGIQGALLDSILERPIYLSSFTICGVGNVASIERAIWKRWLDKFSITLPERYRMQNPTVTVANEDIKFEFLHTDSRTPSSNSIVWCDVEHRSLEIAVGGKRQGVTKKKLNTSMGRLLISKMEIYRQFLDVVLNVHDDIQSSSAFNRLMSYADAKYVAEEYRLAWSTLREKVFKKWTVKKNIKYDFVLKND
ncbi:hypothetical protein HA402_004501 [Bradysia odoriphaga]|nr:hypothetical protein HA402_004501 [Bradysia odoriphaga]